MHDTLSSLAATVTRSAALASEESSEPGLYSRADQARHRADCLADPVAPHATAGDEARVNFFSESNEPATEPDCALQTVDPLDSEPVFFRLAALAEALGHGRKKTRALARARGWAKRYVGNREEYAPDATTRLLLQARESEEDKLESERARPVTFLMITNERERALVLLREQAVLFYRGQNGTRYEARVATIKSFIGRLSVSHRSLQRWDEGYSALGLDGLVPQKQGHSGRPSVMSMLTADEARRVIEQGKAHAIERGHGGKANVSGAIADLAIENDLPAVLRPHINSSASKKNHAPPSVRKAITPLQVTTHLLQLGRRKAGLLGASTVCDWSQVKAGQMMTADDLTPNVYVWTPWANDVGYKILRPQILAALDCGSLAWLCFRVIARENNSYNSRDDVWGLIGQVFDEYGIYPEMLLEGGLWRSNVMLGEWTGLDDESRFGGLRQMGVRLHHSRLPRSKVIENRYAAAETAMDKVKGFCGRLEMRDRPEPLKKQLELIKARKAHPREFLLSFSEFKTHVEQTFRRMMHERTDGEILRGLCPVDKWKLDAPVFRQLANEERHWYRSSLAVAKVTANGLRVTRNIVGEAKHFHWDNPQLLRPLHGARVAIFFDAHRPEADAVICAIEGERVKQVLGVAPCVERIGRFNATAEQLEREARRKNAGLKMAYVEAASMGEHLSRCYQIKPAGPMDVEISNAIQDAEKRAVNEEKTRVKTGANDALAVLLKQAEEEDQHENQT